MNVMVLGATSQIGSEIAAVFAPGNGLLLAGTSAARLHATGERCRERGAERVIELPTDLRQGCRAIVEATRGWPVDVIINSASATSRLRDDEIQTEKLAEYVAVDLLSPMTLIREIWQVGRPLTVVFISSVLAVVKSQNRSIYSSLKILHEGCLRALRDSHPGLDVLVVRVAKVLPPEKKVPDTERLAMAVRRALEEKRSEMTFGTIGRVAAALYVTQPAIFNLAVKVSRSFRPRAVGL